MKTEIRASRDTVQANENSAAPPSNTDAASFAASVLTWFDRYGRKDLPWKQAVTPYSVWVSEIMLQQTQVVTVIPYFRRFLQRFPDVAALASATIDEVLHLWSGLGYYARGRNLHRAAQLMVERHGGEFPADLNQAMNLPGIGRSTAGAVLSLACGQRHPILDGNVKRVLARYFGIEGFPGAHAVSEKLWELADSCTPQHRVADYTQAIMDLGAMVCVRRRPVCGMCPVHATCTAFRTGKQNELPAPRPRRQRPQKKTCMLIAVREEQYVLLERRPPAGLWGGLWGLPEFESVQAAQAWFAMQFGPLRGPARPYPVLRHAFTHFDLEIEPLLIHCNSAHSVMEDGRWLWYDPEAPARLGLAAPVKELIEVCRSG